MYTIQKCFLNWLHHANLILIVKTFTLGDIWVICNNFNLGLLMLLKNTWVYQNNWIELNISSHIAALKFFENCINFF